MSETERPEFGSPVGAGGCRVGPKNAGPQVFSPCGQWSMIELSDQVNRLVRDFFNR
jgi:hypothetical protein